MPDQFNPQIFLPSSRSVAFTKEAWKKSGKYPEHLNYCEDLIFAKNLKWFTNMEVEPQASVKWHIPTNIFQYFHTIKNYASGDIQARYTPHIYKIISTYLRYVAFMLWPPLFTAYLFYAIFKHRHYLNYNSALSIIYLPLIQLTTDSAIIVGSLKPCSSHPKKP